MFKLENSAAALVNYLVDGIMECDMTDPQQADAFLHRVEEKTSAFVLAIRETIIAEIEARK